MIIFDETADKQRRVGRYNAILHVFSCCVQHCNFKVVNGNDMKKCSTAKKQVMYIMNVIKGVI